MSESPVGNVGRPPGRRGVLVTLLHPQLGHRLRRARARRSLGSVMGAWPQFARLIFRWCEENADKWPYVFGGGHGRVGFPSGGGYDCSGIVDAALHAGGVLEGRGTMGTREIERLWGAFGFGVWVTVWVANRVIGGVMVEHVVLEFPRAPASHRFFMAFHTGGPKAGFLSSFNTSGYTAKHKR